MKEKEFTDIFSLKGEELSGVCFVRDYIELHFDGPVVRCLADIRISTKGEELGIDDIGFRASLCSAIGRVVAEVDASEGNELEISFGNFDYVRVEGKKLGAEFAHFISFPEKRLQVWEVD